MKLRTFFCHWALAAATLGFAPQVMAQAAPAPAPTQPSPSTVRTSPSPKKIAALNTAPNTMKGAIAELTEALKSAQLPEINVLYAASAAEVAVPELNLRNVSGAEALRLIATSGNCEAEPIPGDQSTIIGYIIRQNAAPPANPFQATITSGPSLAPGKSAAPRQSAAVAPNVSASLTLDQSDSQKGEYSRGILNISADTSTAVRIYPLGGVTTRTKFAEVEATLREVLKADSIATDSVKFAFHEKTNILVVTGGKRVHELVTQLVEALRKNHLDAEAGNDLRQNTFRAVTEMEVRLNAEQEQKARLAEQLAKAEEQRMKLSEQLAESQLELRALAQELKKASPTKPSN